MAKKSTINDVAELAKVSITTVSRVVNGNYPVKKETKEKVLKAIEELNFTPNDLAVSMIKKKTSTIGVIVPSISNIFFSTLVKGITETLDSSSYTTLLCTSQNNEIELVNKLISRQVDGIIIADSNISAKKEFYKSVSETIPIIFINGYDSDFSNVSCDQYTGTKDALNYLISGNHKNILFVRGSEDSYSYNLKEDIYRGMINSHEILVVEDGNKDDAIKNTSVAINNYISMNRNFTSVFACNDLMAIGVLEGLRKNNINVPEEVSVVGFDNIFLCELVTPKLTSVDQNTFELGKISAENILKLSEKNVKINISINSKLIVRESSLVIN